MAVREQTSSFEPKPFGRYVLLEKLAVGGMAEIYKAKTYGVDGFEKLLAIKRILPHCSADSDFIKMLIDEAKLTVLLSHANIVQVYDLGKVTDDYFISMEFIHGTNLREVINRLREQGERLPEEIAVYIISEVCKGLDYAHRKTDSHGNPLHIVHRDISPQNILISYEGEAKIVDFGIAKAAMNVSHTMAGILKGKVAYMSPEQALGKPIDHRTDIFSTGVVLYELLTGEKLFTGETQFEILNQIRTTRVNTMMLPDHISGPLKAILAKALAYNLKDRYQSAGDFQLDLTKYLYSSYIDFSPRLLASLFTKLFVGETKKKEVDVAIDEKTRSVMISQAAHEDIMVHSPSRSAEKVPPTPQETISELNLMGTERILPKRRRWQVVAIGGVVVTLLAGYLTYQTFWKEGPHPTPVPPEIPPRPPIENSTGDLGSIQISSTPLGAKIFLNGKETGLITPVTLPKLPLGEEYQIKMTKENYKEKTKAIALTTTEPVMIQESLEPLAKGMIEITSNPAGAKILLNDQETGLVTPVKIEDLEIAKNYNVKLTYPNYLDWVFVAEVKGFDPVKLQANLTPIPVIATTPQSQPQTQPPTPATPPPTSPVQPPTPEYGKIKVTSNPSGARVLLNGYNTKKTTPTTLDKLTAGKKVTVALSQDGYQNWSRSLTIEANKTIPLTASLKPVEPPPQPTPPVVKENGEEKTVASIPKETEESGQKFPGQFGSLSIGSEPSGAEVFINSEFKGKTPLKLPNVPAGTVKVAVAKEGFMRQTVSVTLKPNENKSLGTIKLGGMYGEVSINSNPPRASVYFDGEKIGARTPVTIRNVPRDRSHKVRIELDGYRVWESSISLKEKETKRYDVQLEKD